MSRHPAAWTPPAVLPPLPPGEAVRSWPVEVWGAPAVYPPVTAPGFQAAVRLGLLPSPPPAVPPAPVPGLSSWDRMRLALFLSLGVGFMLLLGNALYVGAWGVLLAAVPFCVGVRLLYSTRARDELEFAAGYTSGQSCTGLRRTGPDGRVLRPPDRSVPPPGWYPSPYYPGLLQRCDGPGWKPLPQRWWAHERQYFRAPDRPFLYSAGLRRPRSRARSVSRPPWASAPSASAARRSASTSSGAAAGPGRPRPAQLRGGVRRPQGLAHSRLDVAGGVVTDASCATTAPGVVALGDCARPYDVHARRPVRIEHWTHALQQPATAAATLLGASEPYTQLPYFWSEQYGLQVQLAGSRAEGDTVTVVHGTTEERSFVATYERDGRLVAVLGVGATGPFSRWRRTLRAAAAADVALVG